MCTIPSQRYYVLNIGKVSILRLGSEKYTNIILFGVFVLGWVLKSSKKKYYILDLNP
jgi:hypothetical protein